MFLNFKTLFALALTLLSTPSSFAQKISILEAGSYELVSGEKRLCGDFSLSERDINARTLTVGNLYNFEKSNSSHNIESDIDPSCEFREQNKRTEVSSQEVVLTRINAELCKGKLRSKTVSKVLIRPQEIQVQHQVDNADPYSCVWKRVAR